VSASDANSDATLSSTSSTSCQLNLYFLYSNLQDCFIHLYSEGDTAVERGCEKLCLTRHSVFNTLQLPKRLGQ